MRIGEPNIHLNINKNVLTGKKETVLDKSCKDSFEYSPSDNECGYARNSTLLVSGYSPIAKHTGINQRLNAYLLYRNSSMDSTASMLPASFGAAVSRASKSNPLSSGSYLLAQKLVQPGGTADKKDAELLTLELAKMPEYMLSLLCENGVKVIACKNSITDYFTELKGVTPKGWPPGSTFDQVPGIYEENIKEVVIAIIGHDTEKGAHVPGLKEGHGSANLVFHEVGHAVDYAKHPGAFSSENSVFFQIARNLDLEKITAYEKQPPPFGEQETFAESLAIYLQTPEKMKEDRPHLYGYFRDTFG